MTFKVGDMLRRKKQFCTATWSGYEKMIVKVTKCNPELNKIWIDKAPPSCDVWLPFNYNYFELVKADKPTWM